MHFQQLSSFSIKSMDLKIFIQHIRENPPNKIPLDSIDDRTCLKS